LNDSIRIRPADRTDVPRLFSLIAELAEYERAPDGSTKGRHFGWTAQPSSSSPAARIMIAE
jgi:hypothetical protein